MFWAFSVTQGGKERFNPNSSSYMESSFPLYFTSKCSAACITPVNDTALLTYNTTEYAHLTAVSKSTFSWTAFYAGANHPAYGYNYNVYYLAAGW